MKKYFVYSQLQDFKTNGEDIYPLEYCQYIEADTFAEAKESFENKYVSFVDEDAYEVILYYLIENNRTPYTVYEKNFIDSYLKTCLNMGYKLTQIENMLYVIGICVNLDFE